MKTINLDRHQYAPNGLIPIRIGDDVTISGKLVDRIGDESSPIDCTDVSATAYFPATGGVLAKVVTFTAPENGCFSIDLPQADSSQLCETEEDIGSSFYVITTTDGKLQTIETRDEPLEILQRHFDSP